MLLRRRYVDRCSIRLSVWRVSEAKTAATDGSARRPVRVAILSTKFAWSRRRGAWRFKRNTHRLKQDSVATEELQRIMRSMLNGISHFFRPF